jgi:hypothetical protein
VHLVSDSDNTISFTLNDLVRIQIYTFPVVTDVIPISVSIRGRQLL